MPETPSDHRKSWNPQRHDGDRFVTTQWSLIRQAGNLNQDQSQAALQVLCQNYWFPLYAYARRRMDVEQAKDMTQEFFFVLLQKDYLDTADKDKGRFRAFLITAFKRFLANQHDRERTIKRGGNLVKLSLDFESADSRYSLQPVDDLTPDKVFERQWVLTLLENVLGQLQVHYANKGALQLGRFERLKPMIVGQSESDYAELSQDLEMTADALRVQVHRMRQKYREFLRAEIAGTVSSDEEIDDEIQRLFDVMG